MQINLKITLTALNLVWILLPAKADLKIEIYNNLPFRRVNEMASFFSYENISENHFILKNFKGEIIPYQITYDGQFIFPVNIEANSKEIFFLSKGENNYNDTICYGRIFSERLDDLAWENDKAAYRAYGPALQATGEKAFGYDIWTKSVRKPVLEKRYYDALQRKISFHKDHGEGMDVYAVGPTLGGGTTALINSSDSIIMPYCWKKAKVMDNGPLRFTAELIYNPIEFEGRVIEEHRKISLDAGEWLNCTDIYYHGADKDQNFIAGIVVHSSNPQGYYLFPENNIVSYVDFTQEPDEDNGLIFVGMVGPQKSSTEFIPYNDSLEITGHAVIKMNCTNQPERYYWGGAWSKGGMNSIEEWHEYLKEFKLRKENPLKVNLLYSE